MQRTCMPETAARRFITAGKSRLTRNTARDVWTALRNGGPTIPITGGGTASNIPPQSSATANIVAGACGIAAGTPLAILDAIGRGSWQMSADVGSAAFFQGRQKIRGRELGTPIGVPDLGLAEAEGGFHRRQTEAGLHGVGQFPTERVTAEPIHDRDQVKDPATHRNIRNIGTPDAIGPLDRHATQQVRVDLVTRRRPAQVWFRIKSFDSQNAHQSLSAFAVHLQQ